ncbi:remorin-like [Zingiber officinale]|uniref:remorin-like n=1 Tax=Zingiber officinale TaxID=94328 RepID=UPI001C4B90DC|nr:remorin-like [Zingiber officinale]
MDSLFKQIRVRFSDSGEEPIAPEKIASLKEGKKRNRNWFQRPFPGEMSGIDETADIEFAAAAAAAAYAVALLDEEESLDQNKRTMKVEDNMNKPPEYSRITRWLTGKDQKEDEIQSGGSSMRIGGKTQDEFGIGQNLSKEPNLSLKKKPTFSDKTSSKKPEQEQSQTGPKTLRLTDLISFNASRSRKTTYTTKDETKVDAWERAKMEKIRKRYEKLKSSIAEWEDEKKLKAKRRLERKEGYLELQRARAVQELRDEMARIAKIAGGARALAEERRRNDEQKTKGKARKMRSAGSSPRSCFGF